MFFATSKWADLGRRERPYDTILRVSAYRESIILETYSCNHRLAKPRYMESSEKYMYKSDKLSNLS